MKNHSDEIENSRIHIPTRQVEKKVMAHSSQKLQFFFITTEI